MGDVQLVFRDKKIERIFSRELVSALVAMSDRPWPEVWRGKPITERWLAQKLADFGIHPKTLRIGEERAKGYELSDFGDAFERYLRPDGENAIDDSEDAGLDL